MIEDTIRRMRELVAEMRKFREDLCTRRAAGSVSAPEFLDLLHEACSRLGGVLELAELTKEQQSCDVPDLELLIAEAKSYLRLFREYIQDVKRDLYEGEAWKNA